MKLLREAVSRDKSFIEGLAMKRASRTAELMHLLPQLRDPQSELLLLRSCMGIAKLFFGLRMCQPIHMVGVLSLGTFNGGWLLYLLALEGLVCTQH